MAVASSGRTATESIGPAVLLTALASGRIESQAALLIAGFTGLAGFSGPMIGGLLDRARRPGLVMLASAVSLLVVVVILALWIPDGPMVALLLIAAIGGLAHPALTGGLTGQLPGVIGPAGLARGYSLDASSYNLAAIVGPPLAAAAVAFDARGPLLFVATALLITVIALPFVPFTVRESRAAAVHPIADLIAGFRGLGTTPRLAWCSVMTTVGFAGQGAFLVATPLIAKEQTGSLSASGIVFGAAAVGGLLATLWIVKHPLRQTDRTLVVTTWGVGIAMVVMGVAPVFWLVVVAAFALGAFDGPQVAAMFIVRAREAPEAIRSLVFTTAASLRTGVYAIGAAVCGILITRGVSPTGVLMIGAAMQVASLICAAIVLRRKESGATCAGLADAVQ